MDFGAGKLNNTRTLRRAGVFVSAFEPYFVTTGAKVHKAKSVEIAEKFLEEVVEPILKENEGLLGVTAKINV